MLIYKKLYAPEPLYRCSCDAFRGKQFEGEVCPYCNTKVAKKCYGVIDLNELVEYDETNYRDNYPTKTEEEIAKRDSLISELPPIDTVYRYTIDLSCRWEPRDSATRWHPMHRRIELTRSHNDDHWRTQIYDALPNAVLGGSKNLIQDIKEHGIYPRCNTVIAPEELDHIFKYKILEKYPCGEFKLDLISAIFSNEDMIIAKIASTKILPMMTINADPFKYNVVPKPSLSVDFQMLDGLGSWNRYIAKSSKNVFKLRNMTTKTDFDPITSIQLQCMLEKAKLVSFRVGNKSFQVDNNRRYVII